MTLDQINDQLGAPYWIRRAPDGIVSIARAHDGRLLSTDIGASDNIETAKGRLVEAIHQQQRGEK